jgi:hypothetical protein
MVNDYYASAFSLEHLVASIWNLILISKAQMVLVNYVICMMHEYKNPSL